MMRNEPDLLIALSKARHNFAAIQDLLTTHRDLLHSDTSSPDKPNPIAYQHSQVVVQATAQLAEAIEQLEIAAQAEEEQRYFADAFQESLAALTSSLDVDTVAQRILEYAARVVPYDAASITRYENDIGQVAYGRGYSPEAETHFKSYRYATQQSPYAHCILEGKPYLINETRTAPDWLHLPDTDWIRSTIGVPIMMQDEVIGLLSVDSAEPDQYTTVDVEHLEVFARYAALALKNAYEASHLEEKVTEQTAQLTDAKNRLEAILNNSTDGILLVYLDSGIQQSNETFNTLFGCQEADYRGKPLTTLVDEDYHRLVKDTLQSVLATQQGKTIEVRSRRLNGKAFDAELGIGFWSLKDKGEDGFVCTLRDITERKAQQRELQFYASVQANITDAVIVSDLTQHILTWNKAAERMYGWQAEEVIGKRIPDVLQNQFTVADTESLMEAFLYEGFWSKEVTHHHKNGQAIQLLANVTLLKDDTGVPFGIISVNHDISERKERERQLRFHASLQENVTDGVVSTDMNFIIQSWNKAAERMYGWRAEEVIGKHSKDVFKTRFEPAYTTESFLHELKTTGKWQSEVTQICKDGTEVHVLGSLNVFTDEQGKPLGVVGINHDISERKERERQLRFHASLQENVTDGVIATDMNFTIQSWNKAAERIYGWRADEVIGQNSGKLFKTRFGPDQTLASFQQELLNKGKWQSEVTQIHKDGSELQIQASLNVFTDETGKPLGVVGINHDIGERKERERQLRFFGSLQENVTDAVISTDLDFRIQSWNPAAERIYGWTAEEVIGKSVELLKTHFGSGYGVEWARQDFLDNGYWTEEVVQHHKDGSPIHILSSVVLFKDEQGQPQGIVSVNHDITVRKKFEEALQLKISSELEFQVYLKELHDITIELTQIDQLDDFFRRVVEMGLSRLGFDRLSVFLYDRANNLAIGTYGTTTEGKLHDERLLRFTPGPEGIMLRAFERVERFYFAEDANLQENLQTVARGWNAAAALWDGTQSIGWLLADNLVHGQPASKPQLDILALYAMTVGTLLARKQTDDALRESELRYRLLAENISDVIVRVTATGNLLYVSPSCLTIMGYKPEEMIGQSGFNFITPDDLTLCAQQFSSAVLGERPVNSIEFRFLHKEGYLIWVEATGRIMQSAESGDIEGFICSVRDISERKRAEESIRQALEKEKELGELKSRFVSMTSHEFRTPLANILATTETLFSYRERMSSQQIENRLDTIRGQVDHLKAIIDDVLQMTRVDVQRIEFKPQPLNLDALCQEIMSEFENRADGSQRLFYRSRNIPLEMNLDKKLMRQIITNLISNAVKYSPPDTPIQFYLACEEKVCVLSVADKGIGIPEADLKHMFEPFHRAVNVGTISGTGLGLIISRKAVELHGGTIAIQSKVGVGTTVTIQIPLETQKEDARGENSGD